MHMYGKRRKNGNMSSTFSFVFSMSCGTGRMSYLPPSHISSADMKQFISTEVNLLSFLYFARLCYIHNPQTFLEIRWGWVGMVWYGMVWLVLGVGFLAVTKSAVNIISYFKYTCGCVQGMCIICYRKLLN